jgi:hypothetical protein
MLEVTQLNRRVDVIDCASVNWDLGPNAVDPNAPPKPWPVAGQQVYIKDQYNFCINLPNPDDSYLKQTYYNLGQWPTVVGAEGHVRCFCQGSYIAPGCLPMPAGAITASHVIKDFSNPSAQYYQINGRMDCAKLKINCNGDNSGQCKLDPPVPSIFTLPSALPSKFVFHIQPPLA